MVVAPANPSPSMSRATVLVGAAPTTRQPAASYASRAAPAARLLPAPATPLQIVAGVAGLVATALFVEEIYLGIGIGGMERIAAYEIPIWSIVAGASLLRAPS